MVEITSTVHISNFCYFMEKCAYCGFAVGTSPDGYLFLTDKKQEEIKKAAISIAKSGIKRVSISAGYGNFYKILKGLEIIKENTKLKVLINIGGDLNRTEITLLKSAGVDTICCNLETMNLNLFRKLKPEDSIEKRMKVCYQVKETGTELSSGLLVGIGETEKDRQLHLEFLNAIEVDEVPVMGFHPYRGTPMEQMEEASLKLQLKVIKLVKSKIPSLKRLTVPFPTIGKEGIIPAVKAGATNIATVIPKNYPLPIKGVGSPSVGILEEILTILEKEGIKADVKKPVSV